VDPSWPVEEQTDLLGIYLGTPLTERDGGWAAGALPDRIILFRGPLTRMCADAAELREEIAITIVHEAGHHIGIDEERLHELGWG
ncbi:metallopeptidase family protein, partial [Janibacter sp. RAF20_2_2]